MADNLDYYSTYDTSFVVGDSPIILDIATSLNRISNQGEIICDGSGDILIALSYNGTDFDDNFLVKDGEFVEYENQQVRKIKITHSGSDSSYRVRAW